MIKKKDSKIALTALRISLGWIMFYAGITKVLNPEWSAAGYLNNAQTFPSFYTWLAGPDVLPIINFLNEWGLTLIGLALILGLYVRVASIAGAILMLLYYFPILSFPHAGDHSLVVDDHIIYVLVFVLLYVFNAGKIYGLDNLRKGNH